MEEIPGGNSWASTQPGRPAEDPVCEQPPPTPMIDQIEARFAPRARPHSTPPPLLLALADPTTKLVVSGSQ